MSLICGSLKWLLDAQERIKNDLELNIKNLNDELKNTSLGSNWLEEHSSLTKLRHKRDQLQNELNRVLNMENRIENIKTKAKRVKIKASKLAKHQSQNINSDTDKENQSNHVKDDDDDDEILLNDYLSDDATKFGHVLSDSELENEEEDKYCGLKVRMKNM